MNDDLRGDKQMSFIGHLEELRWRLVKSAIAILAIAVTLFVFTESIVDTLYMSMIDTDFPTYRFFCWFSQALDLDDALCATQIPVQMQSTSPTSQFSTNMYFAIVGGIITSFPFIFYQLWCFVKPALKEQETKVTKGVIVYASILFFFGILFGYYLVSPLCVQFFGTYKITEDVDNIFTIASYMSLITTTTFFSGLFFELPIVIFILTKLGIVSPELLKKYRKHALVVILILSAVITPPDVISQVLVSLPILVLYEIGIYVSKVVVRNKQSI